MTKIMTGIYVGRVIHERLRPRRHRLSYGVFSLLVDLDNLESIGRKFKYLSYNRWSLYSILDKDHGDGHNLRSWVNTALKQSGLESAGHSVSMLCYPRILGYVFNPLTVFFCYNSAGHLNAIIYEVHNTFRERHAYVLGVNDPQSEIIKQSCDKNFYVSPFVPMGCKYEFRISPPSDNVRVVIREEDYDGLLLTASFGGDYFPLSDMALIRMAFKFPLMTLKVIAGIHIEALRLWLKKAPYFPHEKKINPVKKNSGISTSTANK